MKVLKSRGDIQNWRATLGERSLGFVPTMGALHRGHISLVETAQKKSDAVLMSIFVNPTQFNDPEDFEKYPRTLERDLEALKETSIDAIWIPDVNELYPPQSSIKIVEHDLAHRLCGAHRHGHFDGVLTVVMKLFQIVKPQMAFFGEKDFQQLLLIEKMVREYFLHLEIVRVPTVRAENGLALSSRNQRLSPEEMKIAPLIYKTLVSAGSAQEAQATLQSAGFKVEYVEDLLERRFAAAWLGKVRLIDNVPI